MNILERNITLQKTSSRFIAVLLTLTLIFGLLPTLMSAADYTDYTDSNYCDESIFIAEPEITSPAAIMLSLPDWQDALGGALAWLIASTPAPSLNNEWDVMSVARAGIAADDWYNSYLAALSSELSTLETWTDFQRVTLALTALGVDATNFNGLDLTASFRNFVPSAQRPAHSQGANADIFALLALDSKPYAGDRAQFVDSILAAQMPSGAWAFGTWEAVDLTAMAIQALAPYYGGNATVRTAVDRGLDFIADDGNWPFGDSAEDVSQVIIALTALGRPASSYVNRLLAFYDAATGGFITPWTGDVNIMSTEQAARALVAYHRFNNNMNAFFDMRDAGDWTAPPPPLPPPPPPPPQQGGRAHISVQNPHANQEFFSGYFDITTGETAFSLLQRTNLDLITRGTYVVSIAGLAEFDYGANSGWMFSVNGVFPQIAASMRTLSDGDRVAWLYTHDLGQDIGGDWTPPPPPVADDEESEVDDEDGEAAHSPVQEDVQGQPETDETEQAETEQPETEQIRENIAEWTNPFSDVSPDDWFYDNVRFVYERDIMTGTAQGVFSPELKLSRAMLVTMVWRLEGRPLPEGSGAFTDVPHGHWYSIAVAWARENGIVSGFGDETFRPGDNATREQYAAILHRYAGFNGADTSGDLIIGFDDSNGISAWALEDMQWAVANGIISGRTPTTLVPHGTATRAEAAATLQRFIELPKE